MDGERLAFAGMAAQAEMVRSGEVTPSELVDLHLGRIERLNPQLNAFRVVRPQSAREQARAVEARLEAKEDLPLAGVPIAIKDSDDVEGEITTWGSRAFTAPARADAEFVRRLRAAGAVIVGKTNLPELAIFGFTETAAYGASRNQWNTDRTPGGSSGGSAAAVAAGLVAAASASDGGGSIRIPAAFCGLVGLKPQRDRIPLAPWREHWFGLSVVGAETRSVADTALWLDVTADSRPQGSSFSEAARRGPGRLRIAWSVKAPRAALPPTVDHEVKAAVIGAAELLTELGHEVAERDPDWGMVGNNMTPLYLAGIAEHAEHAERPELYERRTKGFIRMGSMFPAGAVRRAREGAKADWARIGRLFDDHDVLMTPVVGEHSIEVGRWEGAGAVRTLLGMSRAYPFCIPWNHIGNPAISVPAGLTQDGLPLSVQLVGRPEAEDILLSLAAQIEEARPWRDLRPPVS